MDIVLIRKSDLEETIRQAALLGAETAIRKMPKNRPGQFNIQDAAKELGIHRHTVKRMLDCGAIRLNACGKISASEIDRILTSS